MLAIIKRDDKFEAVQIGDVVESFDSEEAAREYVTRANAAPSDQDDQDDQPAEQEQEAEDTPAVAEDDKSTDPVDLSTSTDPLVPTEPVKKAIPVRDLLVAKADRQTGGSFKAVGSGVWVASPTNGFKDVEGEIIPTRQLEAYAARAMSGIVPMPELWHYHTRGTAHGSAEWVGVVDHSLIVVGRFEDSDAGRAAEDYYRKAKPGDISMSHGFFYNPVEFKGGVYGAVNIFEISTLPRGVEANPFTSFAAVKEINNMPIKDNQREAIARLFGDAAPTVFARIEQISETDKALADMGAAYKGAFGDVSDAAITEAQAETDQSTKSADDVFAFVTEISEDVGTMSANLIKTLKGLDSALSRIEHLEKLLEVAPSDVRRGKAFTADSEGADPDLQAKIAADLDAKQGGKTDPFAEQFPGLYD